LLLWWIHGAGQKKAGSAAAARSDYDPSLLLFRDPFVLHESKPEFANVEVDCLVIVSNDN
jgi:hypothetical protein